MQLLGRMSALIDVRGFRDHYAHLRQIAEASANYLMKPVRETGTERTQDNPRPKAA
jgi:hypothetical protein